MINDNYIIKYFENKQFNISVNSDINIIKYLANRFNDSTSIKETYLRIKYKIYNRPIYKYCGKPLKFMNVDSINEVFSKTCGDQKCQYESKKESMFNHYGITNNFQSEKSKEKIKQTCLERYGTTSYKKTKECTEKIKQTCLKKYGVDNVFKVKEKQEKYKQTCLERYGVDHNWKIIEEQEKVHSKNIIKKRLKQKQKMELLVINLKKKIKVIFY